MGLLLILVICLKFVVRLNMKYIKGYLDRFLGIYMYRIFRNFCDDLIFVIFFKL